MATHLHARLATFMSSLPSNGTIIYQEKAQRLPYRSQNKTIYARKTISLHRPFALTLIG